jgi:hypothetical protein
LCRERVKGPSVDYGTFEGGRKDVEAVADRTEVRARGSLGARTYYSYIRAGTGPFTFFLFIFVNVLTQALYTSADYWLTVW